ncbi:MAG: Nicotinate-nucleotide adenylyltransferase [Haliscomenobacter sp.]|jgi:nicotinate-nucleotide adenylyltransferase|nr:Nicotinate-nucleotide adenylyltransferase [Haliscomenobacter sp.]
MRTGLFFGSFNPIHVGHLIIANYMATQTDLREVWMVVSPHNPLKQKQSLARDYDRLHLVQIAVADNPLLKPSDIEFSLPKPSYTIDTLIYLKEKYPSRDFVLIMGSDNLATLEKWKNYDILLRDYAMYVYLRPGFDPGPLASHPAVRLFDDVPLMLLSSSYIRDCLRQGKSVKYLVSEPVYAYLNASGIYR